MTIPEFIAKWRKVELKERSAAQEHFIDLCNLFDHPTPAADPTGESFCFEKGAAKHEGGDGFADVWKRGFFGCWISVWRKMNRWQHDTKVLLLTSNVSSNRYVKITEKKGKQLTGGFMRDRHRDTELYEANSNEF